MKQKFGYFGFSSAAVSELASALGFCGEGGSWEEGSDIAMALIFAEEV